MSVNYIELLKDPIAFHPIYAQVAGGAGAGVFVSQLVYWHKTMKKKRGTGWHGWFYKSATEWDQETCTTRRERENAEKVLKSLGVLETQRKGTPATKHYRINENRLNESIAAQLAINEAEETLSAALKMEKAAALAIENNSEAEPGDLAAALETARAETAAAEMVLENAKQKFKSLSKPNKNGSLPDMTNKFATNDKDEEKELTSLPDMTNKLATNDKQVCKKQQTITETTQRLPDTFAQKPENEKPWKSEKGRILTPAQQTLFKTLWDAYDNKQNRAGAIDAFLEKLLPWFGKDAEANRKSLDLLISAINAHKKHRTPGQTPLYFDKWIRAARWQDEYPLSAKISNSMTNISDKQLRRPQWELDGFESFEHWDEFIGEANHLNRLLSDKKPTLAQKRLIEEVRQRLKKLKPTKKQALANATY